MIARLFAAIVCCDDRGASCVTGVLLIASVVAENESCLLWRWRELMEVGMVGKKLGSDCSDVCALELVREFFRYVFFRYVFFLDKTF